MKLKKIFVFLFIIVGAFLGAFPHEGWWFHQYPPREMAPTPIGAWGYFLLHFIGYYTGWGGFFILVVQKFKLNLNFISYVLGVLLVSSALPLGPLGHYAGGLLGWKLTYALTPYLGSWGCLLLGMGLFLRIRKI
jgi:hypothetical protein